MTTDELRLTIVPGAQETRFLMTEGPDDVLLARLRPVTQANHRWAAPMLLEALATWQGRPLRVVLSADADGLLVRDGPLRGSGARRERCTTWSTWSTRAMCGTWRRLRGVGDFRDARRQLRLVWSR